MGAGARPGRGSPKGERGDEVRSRVTGARGQGRRQEGQGADGAGGRGWGRSKGGDGRERGVEPQGLGWGRRRKAAAGREAPSVHHRDFGASLALRVGALRCGPPHPWSPRGTSETPGSRRRPLESNSLCHPQNPSHKKGPG